MQRKTSILETSATYVGLQMSTKKTKVTRINTRRKDSIKISGSGTKDTEEFTYLGSTVTKEVLKQTSGETFEGKKHLQYSWKKNWKSVEI